MEVKKSLFHISVIFLVLFFHNLPFKEINEDEEMYFKSSVESKISLNQNLDNIDHRFLYNIILKKSIHSIGFENTKTLGRFFLSLFFSIALFLLFSFLSISLYGSLIVLISFLLIGQNFFGELQIFKGLLASDLSYLFSFFGFIMLFKNNFKIASFFLIVSTYFHFLIGGYSFLFFITYFFIISKKTVNILQYLIFYIVIITPLLIILYNSNNVITTESDNFLSADYIYSYVRHPHHLLPFLDIETFFSKWFMGISIWLASFAYIYKFRRVFINENLKKVFYLLSIVNFYLLIFFVVSFFDKNLFFSKFYFFRNSSLSLFLSLILISHILIKKLNVQITPIYFTAFTFIFVICISINYKNLNQRIFGTKTDPEKLEVFDFINSNIYNKTFLIQNGFLDFYRMTSNKSLFSNKFIQTNEVEILSWYSKKVFHQNIFSNNFYNDSFTVDFIISEKILNLNVPIELIFSNRKFFIYKITRT